jgi:hypothetical protein
MVQQTPLPLPELVNPATISSWWPLAPGWWLMLFALLATLIAVAAVLRLRHRRNRYRRAALNELDQLQQQSLSLEQFCQQSMALLKRTAIAAYGANVAGLSGREWLLFMQCNSDFDPQDKATVEQLISQQYQPVVTLDQGAITRACRHFISQHRVPAVTQ